ncbi:MAG TPA: acyltransferase [Candidatus Binataceae bacterium]|nr:acyltransferase [Candidatus Binataceae bacterium]
MLRFFAFLAVFLQHSFRVTPARYFPVMHQNWIGRAVAILQLSGSFGVDLFFVLSAFLITQLLVRERESTGTLDIPRFYIRRILRIWPLYFAYVAVLVVAGFLVAKFHTPAKWLLLLAMLSGNIAYAIWGWAPQLLSWHLWSISVEEQFYLLWPLVVRGRGRRNIVAAAIAMIAVSVLARTICWMTSAPAALVWTNTLTRLDPLAAGILLAVLTIGKRFQPRAATRSVLLLAGVAMILAVSAWCNPFKTPNSALTLFLGYPAAGAGCAMIVAAFLGVSFRTTSPLARTGIYLGKISYGLYIWHLLALAIVLKALARPLPWASEWIDTNTFAALCALGLTIALAAVSYRLLERPFLNLKSRFALIPSRPA